MPVVDVMDAALHIANGITDVVEIIVHSLLLPLKVSRHLRGHQQAMLSKLSGEGLIGNKGSRRTRRRSWSNKRNDRLRLRSRSTLPNTHPLEESAVDVN